MWGDQCICINRFLTAIGIDIQKSMQCVYRTKSNPHSGANRTLIPGHAEPSFRTEIERF